MPMTDFGREVRKARIDADVSLGQMAKDLDTTASFLSTVEMGRKKIPEGLVQKIETFFASRNIHVSLGCLADVANKQVSLDGLSTEHQKLIAGLARRSFTETELRKFSELIFNKERVR